MEQVVTHVDDCERLRSRCVELLNDKTKIDGKMQAVQKKIKAKRREKNHLQQSAFIKQSDIDATIEEYAKAVCLSFCDKMYHTLPSELRDMVYGYINTESNVFIPHYHKVGWEPLMSYFDSKSESEFRLYDASSDVLLDHWWNPDYVSPSVLRELGEHYYRTTCFTFGAHFDIVPKFRITDQWELGFIPVTFVAHVRFEIDCGRYRFNGLNNTPDSWDGSCNKQLPIALLSELESLFGFKQGTKLEIRLEVGDMRTGGALGRLEWVLDEVVTFILQTVQRLQDAGYHVRVHLVESGACGPQEFTIEGNSILSQIWRKDFEIYKQKEAHKILQQAIHSEAAVSSDDDDENFTSVVGDEDEGEHEDEEASGDGEGGEDEE
ncbi:hypothetical protein P153DRAFT_401576 [Dothidotthia symphoricarpi CBS 119687]|uniref:Uncharacterized protein n=1 Tax=Dothidotthia symphoricarpi CBS 119687 TaxID=1392245 RepID=A0A6A5ZWT5_9PLEO|nr:uncharacterized protein P153DRAFT_401576 [Dothidotthia symphoricarpi CBS 119687]KAF2124040.1 hypothetical protein P153DRAFT_401576 [Dothidotthia symphoricarpi CBS 119687]